MVIKYFYIYSFEKLCNMFPALRTNRPNTAVKIHGGWVVSMKKYTGKAYPIQKDYGNTYGLDFCEYVFDKRLGRVLEVQTDKPYRSGHPFLVQNQSDPKSCIISTMPNNKCIGQVINLTLRSIIDGKQQLHNLFQSCRR